MNSSRCEYCGHFNRAGVVACAACNFPLGGDRTAGWARPSGKPFGQAPPVAHVPPSTFRNVGDALLPMLSVYRKHFTLVGALVLTTTVPEALIRYKMVDLSRAGVALTGAGLNFATMQGWFLWLLMMAGYALLSGALVYAVVDLQRTGSASAGECLSRALKLWPRLFLLAVLQALIVFVGYVVLVVPGIILSLMFAVCVPVAVIEGRGPVAALKRSCELTRGRKGLIFITTYLWGLFILVLNWIVVWSYVGGKTALLPRLLLQTAVLGMLTSSAYVLNVYVYLGLLRARQSAQPAVNYARGHVAVP